MTIKTDKHMLNIQQHLSYASSDLYLTNHDFTVNTENEFNIELITAKCSRRKEVENFIQASYTKHFDANLKTFFPVIITVIRKSDKSIISALGLRYADKATLFSECYLDDSIESMIGLVENCTIDRNKIIELGNFVVREKSDIKKVMPVIAVFLKSIDVEWLVYTLTSPIKMFFSLFNLELCHLQDAHKSCVNGAADDWGKYYHYKPAVYYTSVTRNSRKI